MECLIGISVLGCDYCWGFLARSLSGPAARSA
jgi:hypothetical protein